MTELPTVTDSEIPHMAAIDMGSNSFHMVIARTESGEIRPVPGGEERLAEAAKHGFTRAIVPKANTPRSKQVGEMTVVGVSRLSEAIDAIA